MRVDIPEGLLDLQEELEVPMDELLLASAEYTRDIYRYYIDLVEAVRTGDLMGSVHIEDGPVAKGGKKQKYIVASADYAKVVEYGWTERGRGQDSYPGRFPAQLAVEFIIHSLDSGLALDALKARIAENR